MCCGLIDVDVMWAPGRFVLSSSSISCSSMQCRQRVRRPKRFSESLPMQLGELNKPCSYQETRQDGFVVPFGTVF